MGGSRNVGMRPSIGRRALQKVSDYAAFLVETSTAEYKRHPWRLLYLAAPHHAVDENGRSPKRPTVGIFFTRFAQEAAAVPAVKSDAPPLPLQRQYTGNQRQNADELYTSRILRAGETQALNRGREGLGFGAGILKNRTGGAVNVTCIYDNQLLSHQPNPRQPNVAVFSTV